MKRITENDLREHLRAMCAVSTQMAVAARLGFSRSYINEVIKGKRPMTEEVAKALGYQQKIYFEKCSQ